MITRKLYGTFITVSLVFARISQAGHMASGVSVCTEGAVCEIGGPQQSTDTIRQSQASPQARQGAQRKAPRASFSEASKGTSNLPADYRNLSWAGFTASDRSVIVTAQIGARVTNLRAGDVLKAVFEHEIEVWPGIEAPIRAVVTEGPYRGAFVSGVAKLDANRKRVLCDFTRLRPVTERALKSIAIKASATEISGKLGLEGEYHSESGKFFVAQVLASAAAGFTDATIQRQQNGLGNWVQEPSLENAAKAGAATAVSKRAERWAQQEAQAPEWTETKPFHEILIFIQADATEDNQ